MILRMSEDQWECGMIRTLPGNLSNTRVVPLQCRCSYLVRTLLRGGTLNSPGVPINVRVRYSTIHVRGTLGEAPSHTAV